MDDWILEDSMEHSFIYAYIERNVRFSVTWQKQDDDNVTADHDAAVYNLPFSSCVYKYNTIQYKLY